MKKYKEVVKKNLYCFILGPLFMILEACGEFILPFVNANIINKKRHIYVCHSSRNVACRRYRS